MIIAQFEDEDLKIIRKYIFMLAGILYFITEYPFFIEVPGPFFIDSERSKPLVLHSSGSHIILRLLLFYFLLRVTIDALIPLTDAERLRLKDEINLHQKEMGEEEDNFLKTKTDKITRSTSLSIKAKYMSELMFTYITPLFVGYWAAFFLK